jgi:hypothetical protein
LGSIIRGDKVIIIKVTSESSFGKLLGKVGIVISIDPSCCNFPFLVLVEDSYIWVAGVLYSPLMMELV